MHLLRIEQRSIDGTAEAVDLDQTPADIVVLSFSDTDLSVLAAAWNASFSKQNKGPGLRLANLNLLRHPYSVDLYIEKVLTGARFVLLRLLGGKDYWSYGVDELAMLARRRGIALAIVPGDFREDRRLEEASTLEPKALRRISAYFDAGGPDNLAACLRFIEGLIPAEGTQPVPAPLRVAPASGWFAPATHEAAGNAPCALIIFYRAWMLAEDTAPVTALAEDLAARGFRVKALYVSSLKDPNVIEPLRAWLIAERPDVVLNMTAFSARSDSGISVLDHAGSPVFQVVLSGGGHAQWAASQRGLGPADLAMNVVLPELDGRIIAGAISFKAETERNPALEFTRLIHQPEPSATGFAADLALAWARLRRTPRAERRLACILSDYPAKSGRTGYAVGLDTPRSVVTIAERLSREGFSVEFHGDEKSLIAELSSGEPHPALSVADYRRYLSELPRRFVDSVHAAWGDPGIDPAVHDGSFRFRNVRAGNLLIAVQPDRGALTARQAEYHDPLLLPRHGYIAFYVWLRHSEQVHAIIQCGTHGTLEWLPGKAVALSEICSPRAVLGPVPLIYPFIVNNPGEAAQAKRRTVAVTIGHLTPKLTSAGSHGVTAEIEGMFDEYAEAQSLDPRRAARLAALIMARAEEAGLTQETGIAKDADPAEALLKLDAWLCDLKDLRIGDGLHVFGQVQEDYRSACVARISGDERSALHPAPETVAFPELIASCADAEMRGLLTALDGAFVPPGPAGAPDRGRVDVLPTGRNLFSIDPRAVPTRTAWEIGRRTAEELLARHAQDHGDWPRRIVLDLWGSATMRTGGDDLAQAFALLGVRPRWDDGSNRVAGFDILPLAILHRPRIDVTLRISGLFRDVFPAQIALFAEITREVAALDEAPEDNPLAASVRSGGNGHRLFGAAPGAYGIGLSRVLAGGGWTDRDALGEAYLRATSHVYGASETPAAADFRDRVAAADAYVHVQDQPGQDALNADAIAEHGGGFAAAAAALGNHPALYHVDTTSPECSKVRTMREDVARVLRARAANPKWLRGQMRHGYRGAAEIAETVDNFFAYAALTEVTGDHQFDLLFDATLGDEAVRAFLAEANPAAASAIAERFQEAARRGFWATRRNSAAAILAGLAS